MADRYRGHGARVSKYIIESFLGEAEVGERRNR